MFSPRLAPSPGIRISARADRGRSGRSFSAPGSVYGLDGFHTDLEVRHLGAEVAASLLIGFDRLITPQPDHVTAGIGADEKWRR